MKEKFIFFLSFVLFLMSGLLVFLRGQIIEKFLSKSLTYELADLKVVEEIKKQTGTWDPNFPQPIFLNAPAPYPLALKDEPKVLGEVSSQEEKWIEIDLSKQKLYAHEGDKIVYEFLISSGKWAPTPTGEFRIWIKLRYATMHGGNPADGTYYYLPNVPYVMYFYKGYGLHGTYWHNNFGTPMSHGCVNLATTDAEKLYWWSSPKAVLGKTVFYPSSNDPGTKVIIHK